MRAPPGKGNEPLSMIRTKFERPRLRQDLVPRPCLLGLLDPGLDGKLVLISAQAGAGKTTLLAQWLGECPLLSAWLALDEYDDNLIVFLGYLIGAICTVKTALAPKGSVLVWGERWTATSEDGQPIDADEQVQVTAINGFKLKVKKFR